MGNSVMEWIATVGEWAEYWTADPPVAKRDGALRFGILGAAMIAPQALISPAKSHTGVIVAAVAARDVKRAEAYAKKYGIPIVHKTYDDLINDPAIDCIYIPLPNGLHYEWALKALKAGRHVLLEKPASSNAEETRSLVRHPVLQQANAPVFLEARHYQFHPAWHAFLSKFDPKDVKEASARSVLPAGIIPNDNIRFNYKLGGGALLDLGTYPLSALRAIFGAEPTSITSATARVVPKPFDQECDQAMSATYTFPNGGTGTLLADIAQRVVYDPKAGKSGFWKWLFAGWPNLADDLPPWLSVTLHPQSTTENGQTRTTQKTIVMKNFMACHMGHAIIVSTTTTTHNAAGEQVAQDTHTLPSEKHYTFWEGHAGDTKGGEKWSTYRYMLEAFVDRVQGRKGSGAWVSGEESLAQMEAIDRTYLRAGLTLRPSSSALE